MADAALNLVVVIRAADLERFARFYAALGVRFSLEQPDSGLEHLAAGAVLEVHPAGETGGAAGVRLRVRGPHLAAAMATVVRAGGNILTYTEGPGPGERRAVVTDPEGNEVELVEERQPAEQSTAAGSPPTL